MADCGQLTGSNRMLKAYHAPGRQAGRQLLHRPSGRSFKTDQLLRPPPVAPERQLLLEDFQLTAPIDDGSEIS